MNNGSKTSIVLTGSHRSGTTWVASVLRSAGGYILLEPMNIGIKHPYGWPAIVDEWYPLPEQSDMNTLNFHYRRLVSLQGDWHLALRESSSLKDLARVLREYVRLVKARRNGCFPIIKDPFSLLLLNELEFPIRSVVLVRHPVAFVKSVLRKKWTYPLVSLKRKFDILGDRSSCANKAFSENSHRLNDPVVNAALIWLFLHEQIAGMRGSAYLVRHEDLSIDPIINFQKLFEYLGLTMSENSMEHIKRSTRGSTVTPDSNKTHVLKRDSQKLAFSWRAQMPAEFIKTIREVAEPIASIFYSDDDW